MSSEALGHVWRYSPHRGPTFLVLVAIADLVNDANENEFWMSTTNLAMKTRMARSTVSGALKEIEESGWIRRKESQKGKTVRYVFVLDDDRPVVWNSRNLSASRTPTYPAGGQVPVRNTDTTCPSPGHNTKTKPNTNGAVFELTKTYFDNLVADVKPSGKMIAGQIAQALKSVNEDRLRQLVTIVAKSGVPVTPGTLMVAEKQLREMSPNVPTPQPALYDRREYEEMKAKAVPMPAHLKEELRKALRK